MSEKILVVDDNLDAIAILEAVLEGAGYPVTSARDGLEAMRKITTEEPALILLDVMMPKMDGYEVCQAVKGDPKLNHIPILMVSARTDPASKERGLNLGAADYLVKPIQPALVLRKVKEHLEERNPPSSPPGVPPLSLIFLWEHLAYRFQLAIH